MDSKLIFLISRLCHDFKNVVLFSWYFLDILKIFVNVLIFTYLCLEEWRSLMFHSNLWMNLFLFLAGKYSFFQFQIYFRGVLFLKRNLIFCMNVFFFFFGGGGDECTFSEHYKSGKAWKLDKFCKLKKELENRGNFR